MSLQPTPNLGLLKFAGTDDFDFAQVNQNADAVDSLAVCTSCTAATRPTSNRYIGRLIWQTDTSEFYLWNGAAWVLLPISAEQIPTVCTSTTRPTTNLYTGRMIYETDTAVFMIYQGGWNTMLYPGDNIRPTVCTSTTRPTTNLYTGRMIYETDTLKFQHYRGDIPGWEEIITAQTRKWVTYTPPIGGPTVTGLEARYRIDGDEIEVEVFFVVATQGTAGTAVTVQLPVVTRTLPVGYHYFGDCVVKDASGQYYRGACAIQVDVAAAQSVMTFYLPSSGTSSLDAKWLNSSPFALASPDNLSANFKYRTA